MDKDASKSKLEDVAIAPEVAGLGVEERARLSGIKERLETHVASFDGREMWYQERMLQFQGTAHITTDEWGVRVRFESANFRTLTLSGRWDVIVSYSNGLSAQYCDWSLCLECPWPELGVSYG
jgi:hypothetical protein